MSSQLCSIALSPTPSRIYQAMGCNGSKKAPAASAALCHFGFSAQWNEAQTWDGRSLVLIRKAARLQLLPSLRLPCLQLPQPRHRLQRRLQHLRRLLPLRRLQRLRQLPSPPTRSPLLRRHLPRLRHLLRRRPPLLRPRLQRPAVVTMLLPRTCGTLPIVADCSVFYSIPNQQDSPYLPALPSRLRSSQLRSRLRSSLRSRLRSPLRSRLRQPPMWRTSLLRPQVVFHPLG